MTAEQEVVFTPNPGPQTKLLESEAAEVGYGGAAGGGKSMGIIAGATRWVEHPEFTALVLRRETPQLRDLVKKSRRVYLDFDGEYNKTTHTWTFPSGATIWLNHCQNLDDWEQYQGQEFHYIAFDELTTFTKEQFVEISARIRAASPGLPRMVRWTSNPGGKGHTWVFERYAPWLDPTCQDSKEGKPANPAYRYLPRRAREDGVALPPAAPGQVLWVTLEGHDEEQTEVFHDHRVDGGESRQFIPALLSDNPKLLAEDPNYERKLLNLDPVRRKQLKDGNWLVKPGAGLYFQRGTFEPIPVLPKQRILLARYWDRAATVNGDWTVGAKLAKLSGGLYVVVDIVRFRGPPAVVEANIKATAALDGKACAQVLEQDPGSAGVAERDYLVKSLAGFNVRTVKPGGDKVTKAGPFSAQAAAGNVKILYPDGSAPAWAVPFFAEIEAFPDGDYDDQVDAASGAFSYLASKHVSNESPPQGHYGDDRRDMSGFVLRTLLYDAPNNERSDHERLARRSDLAFCKRAPGQSAAFDRPTRRRRPRLGLQRDQGRLSGLLARSRRDGALRPRESGPGEDRRRPPTRARAGLRRPRGRRDRVLAAPW